MAIKRPTETIDARSHDFDALTDLFLGDASASNHASPSSKALRETLASYDAVSDDDFEEHTGEAAALHTLDHAHADEVDHAPIARAQSSASAPAPAMAARVESEVNETPDELAAKPATVELAILGHLPMMGWAWAGQYARQVASASHRPVGVVRLSNGRARVEIIDPARTSEKPGRAAAMCDSLVTALASVLAQSDHVIIQIAGDVNHLPPISTRCDRATLLTSSDEAGVVAAYKLLKHLAPHIARAQASRGQPIGVAVMGASRDRADVVWQRLQSTGQQHAAMDIRPAGHIERIDTGALASTIFDGSCELGVEGVLAEITQIESWLASGEVLEQVLTEAYTPPPVEPNLKLVSEVTEPVPTPHAEIFARVDQVQRDAAQAMDLAEQHLSDYAHSIMSEALQAAADHAETPEPLFAATPSVRQSDPLDDPKLVPVDVPVPTTIAVALDPTAAVVTPARVQGEVVIAAPSNAGFIMPEFEPRAKRVQGEVVMHAPVACAAHAASSLQSSERTLPPVSEANPWTTPVMHTVPAGTDEAPVRAAAVEETTIASSDASVVQPVATSSTTNTTAPNLAAIIPGLAALTARCPFDDSVQLAIDDAGTLHLLLADEGEQTSTACTRLTAVAGWANLNAKLIALTTPRTVRTHTPVMHLLTSNPAAARRLLDTPVRVHAMLAASEQRIAGFVCAALN
jgi:hypothetical protein